MPRGWLAATVLVVVAFVAYWPSLTGGFIWDDELWITKNPLIQAADGLSRIWLTTESPDYWPLTTSSFWLEWRWWGLNPVGYHVTNVVLHAVNAFLAWTLFRRFNVGGAFLAALIFLVHPVNVESVAWITQRKNTLSMLFFLLSILSFEAGERHGPGGWSALSLLSFTLAMLSKGSVVILPAVLLLLAWWRHGRLTPRDLLRTLPFFLIGAALTAVNVWFQTHGGEAIRQVTFLERLLGAGTVVWFYLYKALLPIHLSFVYPQWHINASDPRWWAPLIAAAAVTAALFWKRRSEWGRPVLVFWLFFGLSLAPVMGFIDVYFMKYSLVADHYEYLAILGVSAGIAATIDWAIKSPWRETRRQPSALPR